MSNNSVSLHRVFTASPEKVFRAFSEGWQESLDKLKKLVEPVIPDA